MKRDKIILFVALLPLPLLSTNSKSSSFISTHVPVAVFQTILAVVLLFPDPVVKARCYCKPTICQEKYPLTFKFRYLIF